MKSRILVVLGASVLLCGATLALVSRRGAGARHPAAALVAIASPSATAPQAPPPPALAPLSPPPRERLQPHLDNPTAYIPPQCYAVTQDAPGQRTHNGCFACHQESHEPNFVDDGDVQTELSFANAATVNRWSNALSAPAPVDLDEKTLLAWIRTSNYRVYEQAPAGWDVDHDGHFGGYLPDCHFAFDARGFDRAPDGKPSGWRAFAYAPFPGMFWPTNGSAGDVMIRLPAPYRRDAAGREDEPTYALNLAILESVMRRADVAIGPSDERALGVDLDGDGQLATATRVAFVWPPRKGRPFHYVGQAASLDPAVAGWPAAGLYPRGTELLHSVRYLDVAGGRVRMAARMKELRYMKKLRYQSYSELEQVAGHEAREKDKHPNVVRHIFADPEKGVGTGSGWAMQAFIESATGELRPESVEETAACIGCHGGIGVTSDSTFAFARKLGGRRPDAGWYHWDDEHGLAGIPEPRRADGQGEYAHWLAQVGGGDDYRSNDEVQARFFDERGGLRPAALRALSRNIATLLVPSPRRALALDRAYLALVRAQSFARGRDVLVGYAPRLHERRAAGQPTGIDVAVAPAWKLATRARR